MRKEEGRGSEEIHLLAKSIIKLGIYFFVPLIHNLTIAIPHHASVATFHEQILIQQYFLES